jgi:hypothetical protein
MAGFWPFADKSGIRAAEDALAKLCIGRLPTRFTSPV